MKHPVQKLFVILVLFLIPVVTGAQVIETIAGTGYGASGGSGGFSGDGGPCISAEFNHIQCIAFDAEYNIYLADVQNNVVRKISTSGIVTTIAGNGYTYGYTGDGGPATAAQLNGPTCIAFDAVGNLYISDGANSVIRKVNKSGIITTIAGDGTFGFGGDGGGAMSATFSTTYAIAIDKSGNIYVSDEGNYRVRKINTSGIISTIAGNGAVGYNGDGIPATDAKLTYPGYLAVDNSGNVYIPDFENHRVRKVNSLGIITTVAGNGTPGNNGDGGPATAAELSLPNGVNLDDSGNLYISDPGPDVVRKVNTSGIITTVAGGNGSEGFCCDGGPATACKMYRPACVIFNSAKNMYIADAYNNRIRKVTYNVEAVNNVSHLQPNINLYPNPAHDKITINTGEQIDRVDIINLTGQVVTSPRPFPMERVLSINVSDLPSGIYFVKVNGVYSGRFVKE